MTRSDIIRDIANRLPYNNWIAINPVGMYSSTQDLFVAVNNLIQYINSDHLKNQQFVEQVLVILEEHHKLTFHDKVENIIK